MTDKRLRRVARRALRAWAADALSRYAARRQTRISASRLLAAWRRKWPAFDAHRARLMFGRSGDGRTDAMVYGTAVHVECERAYRELERCAECGNLPGDLCPAPSGGACGRSLDTLLPGVGP